MTTEIIPVSLSEKTLWNDFINRNYPPVGAFMQTWEWGEFQEALGRKVKRYLLKQGSENVAAFTMVIHQMPFGFSYGYAPRGPVVAAHSEPKALFEMWEAIKQWAAAEFPDLAFLRLEPPVESFGPGIKAAGFKTPPYYIQPRFNLVIPLDRTEDDIVKSFHPSTRSNIRRAEKRGVKVEIKPRFAESDLDEFFAMARDTIKRNSGKDAYPSRAYFQSFFKTIPVIGEYYNHNRLSVVIFCGYQDEKPAAIHFVLFFGNTATYLYGASYSERLRSKVTTYLHWAAMREAKKRGLKYYDLGGIDQARWPTLTDFKRQFNGQEFRYAGNLDIPIRPALYFAYDFFRRFKI